MRPRSSPLPRSNRFCLEYLEDRTLLAGLTSPVADPDATQLANMDSATVARLILTTVTGGARVGIDSVSDTATTSGSAGVTITITGVGPNSSIIIDTTRLDGDKTHFSLESFTKVTIVGNHKLGSLALSDVQQIDVQVPIVDMLAVSNSPSLNIVSASQIVLTDGTDVSLVAADFTGTTITADAKDLNLSSLHNADTLTLFTLEPKATAQLNFSVTDLVVANFDSKDQIRFVLPHVDVDVTPAKTVDPAEPAKMVTDTPPTIEHVIISTPTKSVATTPEQPATASGDPQNSRPTTTNGTFVIENAVVLNAPSALNVTWLRIVPSVNMEVVTLLSGLKSDPDASPDPSAGKTFLVKSPDPGPVGGVAFAPDPGLASGPAGQPVALSQERIVALPAPERAPSLVSTPSNLIAPAATGDTHHFLATDSTEELAAQAAHAAAKAATVTANAVVASESIVSRPAMTDLVPGAADRNNVIPVLPDRSRTGVTSDPFFATAPPKSATSSLTPGLVTFLSRFIKSSDHTTQVFTLSDAANSPSDHRAVAVPQGDQMPTLAPGTPALSLTEKSPFESLGDYIKTSLRETYAPGSAPVLLTQSPLGDPREEATEPRET